MTELSTRRLRVEKESDISSTVAGVQHHTYSLPAVDACNVDTEETFQCEMDDAIRSIGGAQDTSDAISAGRSMIEHECCLEFETEHRLRSDRKLGSKSLL